MVVYPNDGEPAGGGVRSRPSWLKRVLVSLIPLVPWCAAPFIAMEVLESNARQGLYGDHDALMIPLFGVVLMRLTGLPFFLVVLVFVQNHLGREPCTFRTALSWRLPLAILLISPAALFALIGVLSWCSWPHALIAGTYAIPLLWLGWAGAVVCRSPSPRAIRRRGGPNHP